MVGELMKKYIFVLITCLIILVVIPVNARDLDVCRGCQYETIDSALSAIEEMTPEENEKFNIYVNTWDEQTLSNHTLNSNVYISFSRAGVLRGNGATITVNEAFGIGGNNIEFTDTNIISNKVSSNNPGDLDYMPGALLLEARNLHMNNVKVTAKNRNTCEEYDFGISAYADNVSIENTSVSGFTGGIGNYGRNLSVNNCDLANNIISIISNNYNGYVKESNLSTTISNGDFIIDETNNIGDLKVKRLDLDELRPCSLKNNKGIYIDKYSDVANISIIRKIDIDLNKTKEVKNMLNYFKDENEIEGFIFTIDDESIGTVDDGNIKLLKTGEVTVIAKNEDTRETYTLKINITQPVIPNNPKTSNPVFYIGLVGFIILMISYAFYNYQLNNKKD